MDKSADHVISTETIISRGIVDDTGLGDGGTGCIQSFDDHVGAVL